MTTQTPQMHKLIKSRIQLLLNQPYYGSLLMLTRLTAIEERAIARYPELAGCSTMATDGREIFYRNEFVDECTYDETIGTLAHETEHITRLHHLRMQLRDGKRWNTAADLTINDDVIKVFTLPKGALRDETGEFTGMSTEAIYARLPDSKFEKKQQSGSGSGKQCPFGAGGVLTPRDENGEPLTEEQIEERETEAKARVAAAYHAAKMKGSLPGHLERLIDDLLYPSMNYIELLRRFMQSFMKDDYSWSRPNRRFVASGLYLPSLHSEGMGDVVVIQDTSGSMSNDELVQSGSDIKSVFDDCRPRRIYVVYNDATINHVDVFDNHDDFHFRPVGGGGTAFEPAFEWIEKNLTEPPMCCLFFTDLYGSFPKHPPQYPVLWMNTADPDNSAPWGETIHVDVNKQQRH